MTKAERAIVYLSNECKGCKAYIDVGGEFECVNSDCFEAHSYAIECIRKASECRKI